MAGSFSLALWLGGILTSVQNAFVVLPKESAVLAVPGPWLGAALILTVSFAVTVDVGRFGGRRAFVYLGGGFLILTAVSLLASRFLLVDVLFAPLALAASIAAITRSGERRMGAFRPAATSRSLQCPSRSNLNSPNPGRCRPMA